LKHILESCLQKASAITTTTTILTTRTETTTTEDVSGPPQITQQPINTNFLVGDTVRFTVVVTGSETISYQWKKNGVSITGARSGTLLLTNLQASDEGSYDVVVSNQLGTLVSKVASLTMGQSPS
jgi:hypothetical protein